MAALYRYVFYGTQQMLFDKFDYSGCSVFDGHFQLLSDVDINGLSGGV